MPVDDDDNKYDENEGNNVDEDGEIDFSSKQEDIIALERETLTTGTSECSSEPKGLEQVNECVS